MFIKTGARELLLQTERQKFLTEDWPRIHATMLRLALTVEELMADGANRRPIQPKAKEEER
jgi:GntR family transcriptional regulator